MVLVVFHIVLKFLVFWWFLGGFYWVLVLFGCFGVVSDSFLVVTVGFGSFLVVCCGFW